MSRADGEDLRAEALRRLRARHGFWLHLAVYAMVNLLLVCIWLTRSLAGGSWTPWPLFTLLGWGIGLTMHALSVFTPHHISEQRINQEIDRISDDSI